MRPARTFHDLSGELGVAALAWRLPDAMPWRAVSTAFVGGGFTACNWVLNVQVPHGYARRDVGAHVDEVARALGLVGDGVGMLTAADVRKVRHAIDGEVTVEATVGLASPVWAAAPEEAEVHMSPGTVNIVAFMPVPHRDGALANLLCTATEAKVQALLDKGVPGTGTASDAVTVVCPGITGRPEPELEPEPFGGPRSRFGAQLARATCSAISAGAEGPR